MPISPQHGDPPNLGPFRLTGRLAERSAGIVYLGVDAAGRQAAVALLTGGAAADPAARDRFAAAVTAGVGMRGAPQVIGAQPNGPAPWVATAYHGGYPDAAAFLDPVAMAGTDRSTDPGAAGPRFQPYWAADRAPAVPGWADPPPAVDPAAGGRPRRSGAGGARGPLVGALAVLGVLIVLLVLLVVAVTRGSGDGGHAARGTPVPVTPTSPAGPTATDTPSAGPSHDPGATVVGPTFGSRDKTYVMTPYGMGFAFQAPASWGCMRSSRATPPNERWICIDESGPMKDASVLVEARPCPGSCSAGARHKAIAAFRPGKPLVRSDGTTVYAQWREKSKYRLLMVHFWHHDSTDLNAELVVLGEAAPRHKATIQRIVNDIRAHTS